MKTMEIGAFEAKTRFSELLRQVEQGVVVRVWRRNKHIADLVRTQDVQLAAAQAALARLGARRHARAGMRPAEICALRDQGRKR